MATLVLGAAGAAVGGMVGGSILGISAATIGGAIGTALGSSVDAMLLSRLQPAQRVEGARLEALRVTSATEGTPIPRIFGRMRIGGTLIWATDFREEKITSTQRIGGRKTGTRVRTTEYAYFASFAVALCEGSEAGPAGTILSSGENGGGGGPAGRGITGISRIWADGKPLDPGTVTLRWYPGDEAQDPDPLIVARMGAAAAPAYRGTAYVVFEELALEGFGNRIPQLSFEVFRPLADPDTAEGLTRAVCLIPASGEFAYATEPVYKSGQFLPGGDALGADLAAENLNASRSQTDMVTALDRMEALAPAVESVSLVVAWFGTDLRLGSCEVRPGVEEAAKATEPVSWQVAGVDRAGAHVVSRDAEDRPVYGGTPSDASVIQAIHDLKARGKRVTFYPFILMDMPPGNALPDPYSDDAATLGQPAFPWRGRITVSPAPGFAGSPDGSAAARIDVETFFWRLWGLRRMILHYAQLCAGAGGVDAFLIGTEMRGLTTVRDGPGSYPAVVELIQLAADVRAILGPGTQISYAADWSEYFGHQPSDGSGDVFHHLDPLWADPNTDFVGIDNYMPLSDWRDGTDHADAQAWDFVHDRAYLQANIEGGEGFDWFYASPADRAAQIRTPIGDGWGGPDPARFHDRHAPVTTFPAYPPELRQQTVLFHCRVRLPAAPTDGQLFNAGGGGIGAFAGLRDGGTVFRLRAGDGAEASASSQNRALLDLPVAALPMDGALHDILCELRPEAPGRVRLWVDRTLVGTATTTGGAFRSDTWAGTAGCSYLAGGGGPTGEPTEPWPTPGDAGDLTAWRGSFEEVWRAEPWVFRYKDLRSWWSRPHFDRPGGVRSTTPTPWVPESKPIRFTECGCPAVDRGSNQPNVFFDPKSSESFLPHFSRGWRDDAIQRAYLEATLLYWQDPGHNPVSTVYGGPMIDMAEAAAWTWDARPYPFFPALGEVWSDGGNWRLGHWLTGRLGAVSLAALVRALCARAGLGAERIDVTGLWGAVEGYAIAQIESPRASLAGLMRHFGFDAVETGGVLRFVMRGRRPLATLGPDDLVAAEGAVEPVEFLRAQETELPQGLIWQIARADGDYDAAVVEARQPTTDTLRLQAEAVPFVVAPEEAQRRARRALAETWAGRETAAFRLAPSRLALDPADPVLLDHDGRDRPFRLLAVADAAARTVEAVAEDRGARDLPPAAPEATGPTGSTAPAASAGPPAVLLMDLPQLREEVAPHRPWAAAWRRPWPGPVGVLRAGAPGTEDLRGVLEAPAAMGILAFDLWPGPLWRWDHGNELWLDMLEPLEPLESVEDAALLAGANSFAVRTPAGWEILQAGRAELVAPGRWRLTRLLRGQRGTEGSMGAPTPAGAPVVRLDGAVQPLDLAEAELGLPAEWIAGPLGQPLGDPAFRSLDFTPAGAGLRPFAPVHVAQPWRTARTPGDLTIRWVRRSRALAADSWELAQVPLAEAAEAWEVDILDGAAVKRTLTSGTTSVLYSAAAQTADWGAPLGPGASLRVRIHQRSETHGRGAPGTFTLHF